MGLNYGKFQLLDVPKKNKQHKKRKPSKKCLHLE